MKKMLVMIISCWLMSVEWGMATDYFVSNNGLDTNAGTSIAAPFKTLSKAVLGLKAGDSLQIVAGTYFESMDVTNSGTVNSIIHISNYNGGKVVIDGGSIRENGIKVLGSNVTIESIEVTNTKKNGILITGKNVLVLGCKIYGNVLENNLALVSGGWGAGLAVGQGGDGVVLDNNDIYQNYGEGVNIRMAKNVEVRHNKLHDNYSANLYIDNSSSVLVEGNMSFCKVDSRFYRDGSPAWSFLVGEEDHGAWGAQLGEIVIINNIADGCMGIGAWGSAIGGGLKFGVIANNTLNNIYSAGPAIFIGDAIGNSDIGILNNIAPGFVSTGDQIMMENNLDTATYAVTPNTADAKTYGLAANSNGIDMATDFGLVNDFFGNDRPNGAGNDVGAIEYGVVTPTVAVSVSGDTNGDKVVDLVDFTNWKKEYLATVTTKMADFNKDTKVDLIDFTLWKTGYLK